jgi:nicotinamide-nucleotide amidase
MAIQGKKLFSCRYHCQLYGLLKPGGSASIEKPEGTFFSIYYQNTLSNFKYFIEGEPLTRLNQLTENVAKEILKILNFV